MLWMLWGFPFLFLVLGAGMITGGFRMTRVLHGRGSVEVEARCIYVEKKDEVITGVGNRHIILSDWSDSSGDFCSDLLVITDR